MFKIFQTALAENPLFHYHGKNVPQKAAEKGLTKKITPHEKNIFFAHRKNLPQEIENTSEIIQNMSDIFQNISDIFFAAYTPTDYQVLGGCLFLSAKP